MHGRPRQSRSKAAFRHSRASLPRKRPPTPGSSLQPRGRRPGRRQRPRSCHDERGESGRYSPTQLVAQGTPAGAAPSGDSAPLRAAAPLPFPPQDAQQRGRGRAGPPRVCGGHGEKGVTPSAGPPRGWGPPRLRWAKGKEETPVLERPLPKPVVHGEIPPYEVEAPRLHVLRTGRFPPMRTKPLRCTSCPKTWPGHPTRPLSGQGAALGLQLPSSGASLAGHHHTRIGLPMEHGEANAARQEPSSALGFHFS